MIKHKFGFMLAVLFFSIMIIMSASAQVEEAVEEDVQGEEETQGQGSGIMDTLMKAVGDAAQESLQGGIEDFIGTYKGRIGAVKLLKRQGNSVVLEVKYEGVKRKDGVYVQAEVLNWGEPLDGFNYTLSTLRDKRGAVNLTIGWQAQDISGWGISSDEQVVSDQLRLSLVRETNPERPFGTLVYDFVKTWTSSSDIEVPEETAEAPVAGSEDAIELAEGETAEGQTPGTATVPPLRRPTVILPGAVLAPGQGTATQPPPPTAHVPSPGTNPPPPTAAQSPPPTGSSTQPMLNTAIATSMVYMVSDYNLYTNAAKAQWRSYAGVVSFPGSTNDNRGFVRTLENGMICPNNKALNLLETHPQWVKDGWIEGRYPVMTLGKNVKFKSVGALLKGANSSDGVLMEVTVRDEKGRLNRVLRKRINNKAYTNFEADLSAWEGKKVQLILRVSAGPTSTQDWAVWVNPRLENK